MLIFCFIVVIILLQNFRRMYWQNFTKHHNTSAATKAYGKSNIIIDGVFYVLFRLLFLYFMIWFFFYNYFFLRLISVTKGFIQNLQQKYKTSAATSAKDWNIDMVIVLYCINFSIYIFIFIVWRTFYSNTLLLQSDLKSQTFIITYIY